MNRTLVASKSLGIFHAFLRFAKKLETCLISVRFQSMQLLIALTERRDADSETYAGDYYAYRNAPLLLQLAPGHHKVDVRLIYDVRAMGGQGDPTVEALLHVQRSRCSLAVDGEKLLVSDVVNGLLASNLACVPIRNESTEWLDIWEVRSVEASLRWIHLT